MSLDEQITLGASLSGCGRLATLRDDLDAAVHLQREMGRGSSRVATGYRAAWKIPLPNSSRMTRMIRKTASRKRATAAKPRARPVKPSSPKTSAQTAQIIAQYSIHR